jgi:hypothetical protein
MNSVSSSVSLLKKGKLEACGEEILLGSKNNYLILKSQLGKAKPTTYRNLPNPDF